MAPVRLNCVLVRGFNDDEILDFVEFTKDKDIYFRFIEYMPFDDNSILFINKQNGTIKR